MAERTEGWIVKYSPQVRHLCSKYWKFRRTTYNSPGPNNFQYKKACKVILQSVFLYKLCQIECTSFTAASFQNGVTLPDDINIIVHEATEDETKVHDDCIFSHSVFLSIRSVASDWFIDQYKTQTTDCNLQTMCKMQTTGCRLGAKRRLRIKTIFYVWPPIT